jgi:hypothetical protein
LPLLLIVPLGPLMQWKRADLEGVIQCLSVATANCAPDEPCDAAAPDGPRPKNVRAGNVRAGARHGVSLPDVATPTGEET